MGDRNRKEREGKNERRVDRGAVMFGDGSNLEMFNDVGLGWRL
jgi:hypothetical protein